MPTTPHGLELLPQPSVDELELPVIFDALADPLRLAILHRLLVDAAGAEQSCTWVGLNRPKSTQTHHFRVLREAGLLEQRLDGLERRTRVRVEDIEARFPGLLGLVLDWSVPTGVLVAEPPAPVQA
ncbi:ArsR/SmtB family transcription factor [Curtobacterium ammoniigenes]|uniref:ArsR/SmtB family transcription factor n=1 Tax=Curtobacterium ammoniigenes TaxID=395387 RepID=UPI0008299D80|nr:helix-turn-helix domain-containing protein [Curtobacterium ammoniigenes]